MASDDPDGRTDGGTPDPGVHEHELVARAEQARAEAVAARERFDYLATAGARFAQVLDAPELAELIVTETVGRLADTCIVDRYGPDGSIQSLAMGHVDPNRFAALRDSHVYRSGSTTAADTLRDIFLRGERVVIPELDAATLTSRAFDDVHARLMLEVGTTSVILLPLVARGHLIGGIALGRVDGHRPFDDDDLVLATGLASRAAVALDNARLFEERAAIVRALQATLMPPAIPTVPGLEVAACARVAEGGVDIGGDFYDAFPLEGETVAVVIGDVSGKGPAAAAVTGIVRQAVRSLAPRCDGPAATLAAVDGVLEPQIDDTRFCTAVLLFVTPHEGGARVRLANAGHVHPQLVPARGPASIVPAEGTLLGVMGDIELAETVVELAPGDAIVLVTDGVTEARHRGVELGEAGLRDALDAPAPRHSAAALADHVVAETARFAQGMARDDLAIVVVRASVEAPAAR